MEPTYPSAQVLQTWLDMIIQHTHVEDEEEERLTTIYWESSADDLLKERDQLAHTSQVSQQYLFEKLTIYEQRTGGVFAGPNAISSYIEYPLLHLDPSNPLSGEQILLAYDCVRRWKEKALGFALVRDVLTFLRTMCEERRMCMARRHKARDILQNLLAPLVPNLYTGGLSTKNFDAMS